MISLSFELFKHQRCHKLEDRNIQYIRGLYPEEGIVSDLTQALSKTLSGNVRSFAI